MNGRDIEAFDTKRRRIERKRAFQLQQCLVGAVIGISGAHHIAHEGMAGIAHAHLHQPMLLAALRTMENAFAAALLTQPLANNRGVFHIAGNIDLCGNIRGLVVVALDESRDELLLVHVKALIQNEFARTNRTALAHHKNAGARDSLFTVETDQVDVHACGEHHLLTIIKAIDNLKAAFDTPSALEVELGGGLRHVAFELIDQLTALAGKKTLYAANILGILLASNHACADTRAAAHVVIKARTALLGANKLNNIAVGGMLLEQTAHMFPSHAGSIADGHNLAQGIDHFACGTRIRIGAKVARARPMAFTRVLDSGKGIAMRDGDIGVALVVLEVDIKIRVILLDKIALQNECLVLALDHHVIK